MSNNYLRMTTQPALDMAIFPVPEYDVAFSISRTDPSPIRREADLTSISRDTVSGKALFAILSEVIRRINEDLIIERLCSKPFFYLTSTNPQVNGALRSSLLGHVLLG
jgi:hypothetical protein